MKSKHTPGPWELGEFDELLGYDCMTGGVRSGPAVLDGRDYGQRTCAEISEEGKVRMMADARLIAAAPDLLAALKDCQHALANALATATYRDAASRIASGFAESRAGSAIAKATLKESPPNQPVDPHSIMGWDIGYDQDELDATVAKEIVAAAGAYPDLLAALQGLHDATKAYFQDFEHLHPIIRNRLAQARLAIDKAST